MEYLCSLCDGRLQNQRDADGTMKCLTCGAEHLFNEGLILSERWVKAEIERLRDYVGNNMLMSDYQSVDDMRSEIKHLQFMLDGLRADSKMKSEALTKINNVVQPLWNELRELRGGYQTWEEYWAKAASRKEEHDGR